MTSSCATVLNQTIRINAQPFTIVGVAPKGFDAHARTRRRCPCAPSFKPKLTPNWDGTDRWNDYWLYLFARLKPGVTRAQAAAALNGTYSTLVDRQAKDYHPHDPRNVERFRNSRLTLLRWQPRR